MSEAIGVFDSGIGGLTVVREIVKELPHESLVFLGDTARVPYGSRGSDVIRGFAFELADFMMRHEVKFLVAACNTISSTCLDALAEYVNVPILGVVAPAVQEAALHTVSKRVGVIGTRATIGSGYYDRELHRLIPGVEVFSQACPLFVPLAEEGLIDAAATRLIAEDYLKDLRDCDIDVMILACTHYPLLRDVIQEVIGKDVILVDSARPTAIALRDALGELAASKGAASYDFYVTDAPERVQQVASLFFGDTLPAALRKTSLE